MMFPSIFSLVFLPALCLASGSAHVYLYPTKASLSSSEGPALLAHHLGLEAFESLPQHGSAGEIVLGGTANFVGKGRRDVLFVSVDSDHPEDLMPQSLQRSFSLPADSESLASIIDYYADLARTSYSSVVDSSAVAPESHPLGSLDIVALHSATTLSQETILRNFVQTQRKLIAFLDESETGKPSGRFGAFHLVGLKEIEQKWGRDSEAYMTTASTFKATMESAIANDITLAVIFPSRLSTRQIAQPPQTPFPPPKIPATAPVFSTSTCFASADACRNATASCSSRGACVGVTRAGRTCFVCECGKAPLEEGGKNISWAGNMCQKKDISQQFTLLAGTVLFLILISIGSTALLYSIGDQELPGTLTGGLGGHMKHE